MKNAYLNIPHPRWRTRGIPHQESLDALQQGLQNILPLVDWHPITILIVSSHVFGNAIIKSDVDVAVIVTSEEHKRYFQNMPKVFIEALNDLSHQLGVNIDLNPQEDCRDYMWCYDLIERKEYGRDTIPDGINLSLLDTRFDLLLQKYVYTLNKPGHTCVYSTDPFESEITEWKAKYGDAFVELKPYEKMPGYIFDRYGDN